MGSVNLLLHPDDLTQTDLRRYKQKALAAGISRCFEKSIGTPDDVVGWKTAPTPALKAEAVFQYLQAGGWPPSLDVKNMENSLVDLVVAPALDLWNTAALVAVGAAYSCFQGVAAPQLQDTKLAVFWGVSITTVPLPVSRLIFRTSGIGGNILALFDLEMMDAKDTQEGVFSEPVIIDPRQVFAAQVLARVATGLFARVMLHNYVFEIAGLTVA